MAATLTATVTASINWTYQTALSGSITPVSSSSFTYSGAITNGTGAVGTADLIYAVQTTIAGAGNTTLDLAGSLLDFFGSTITLARVKAIFIKLTTDTAASSVAVGNGSNPFINWISPSTGTITIRNGGCFVLSDTGATAYAVTAGTGDILKILNNDASVTATLQIAIVGSSA